MNRYLRCGLICALLSLEFLSCKHASSSNTSSASTVNYESMTKEQRLDYYVANKPRLTEPGVPSSERDLFFKWRQRDLRSLTPTERSAHIKREQVAQQEYDLRKDHERQVALCGDRPVTVFDDSSEHLWNRLYRALYVRVDRHQCYKGFDAALPYLFPGTSQYLEGADFDLKLRLLDEFNADQSSALKKPLHRALMQRSLLHVYHWAWHTAYPNSAAKEIDIGAPGRLAAEKLLTKLRTAIRDLALPESEIKVLPDNLAMAVASKNFQSTDIDNLQDRKPYVPEGLERDGSKFIVLSAKDGPAAPAHFRDFRYASGFFVGFSIPGGMAASTGYIRSLLDFPNRMLKDSDGSIYRNPATPQFPSGTQVVIIQRALLWSREETAVVSPIVELVQGRAYLEVSTTATLPDPQQRAFELEFSQSKLLRGDMAGGLTSVGFDAEDYKRFLVLADPIERGGGQDPVLGACLRCHAQQDLTGKKNAAGIHSMHSYSRLDSGKVAAELVYQGQGYEAKVIENIAIQQGSWQRLKASK